MAHRHDAVPTLRKLRLPLFLTRLGLLAEQVLRCFWPLMSIVMLVLAALMLGLHDHAPVELVWGSGVVAMIGALVALVTGAQSLRWPSQMDALARLDATLPGRPIQALIDSQAIGHDDPDSAALWRAHQARMAQRAATARAARPDLRIARRDPFALRYVAMLALAVAVLFGSLWRVGTVADMTHGAAQAAAGPSWEGWIEPPRHTGLPTLYLADIADEALETPEGSRVILRFYGEVGALTLAETVSARIGEVPSASEPSQDFIIARSGEMRIDGPGGRKWDISVLPDSAPRVSVAAPPEAEATGQMSLPFTAEDDYGIAAGTARITLDLATIDRRFGLTRDPEPRDAIVLPLPMPISGDRAEFTEKLIEDFSQHPWANLPVTFELQVEDEAGQKGESAPFSAVLPGRRFFDPMASAIIEMRRDLLWSRDNAPRIGQVLRAVSYRPDDVFRSETAYLRLRFILRRLERMSEIGLRDPQVQELGQALWDLAILLEEGDLGDALERLRRAQERLSEAMKNGASDQEIAELMQELRQATDDYMRQLSRQAQNGENGADQPQQGQNTMQMSQDDLQRMMDRIQELMEQGRMAEAQQALEELQQLMENMRVTQGQGGSQSQGQQSMDDLAETLRDQQSLSDQAFRDLQEQFNPNAQTGENQNNEGRNGGQGRGQSHEGQTPGQNPGQNQGQGQQPGGQSGEGGDQAGTLADRQRALRQELNRQQGSLPGAGTPEGDAARDALDRAGRAMDGAEDSLRRDDLAEAIDQQSEAMEALREGLRALGDALAQDQQQSQPGQGQAEGDQRAQNRDPLGRNTGTNGSIGSDENLLQGEDVYRRARELLDEIRRRSGEGERPDVELEYLKRLLERF